MKTAITGASAWWPAAARVTHMSPAHICAPLYTQPAPAWPKQPKATFSSQARFQLKVHEGTRRNPVQTIL